MSGQLDVSTHLGALRTYSSVSCCFSVTLKTDCSYLTIRGIGKTLVLAKSNVFKHDKKKGNSDKLAGQ